MGFALSLDTEKVTWVLEDSRETMQVLRSIKHALYEKIKCDLQHVCTRNSYKPLLGVYELSVALLPYFMG